MGINNLNSVVRAFSKPLKQSDKIVILENGKSAARPDLLILPGLGKFGTGMAALKEREFIARIKDWHSEGTKIVGICLGMQLLGTQSEESPEVEGLNLVSARVARLKVVESERIPHIGWAKTYHSTTHEEFPSLFTQGDFYFVHSYHLIPDSADCILTNSQFGSQAFTSSVLLRNVVGFQFHPEKSGPKGGALISEIINWAKNEG